MTDFVARPAVETGRARQLGAAVVGAALSRAPIRPMNGRRRWLLTPAAVALALVVLGLAAGGAGATLGVADLVRPGDAGTAQYTQANPPVSIPHTPSTGKVLGVTSTPSQNVTGVPERTAIAGEIELPFTGLLVVPLLVLGVALAAVGVVLRRRTAAR